MSIGLQVHQTSSNHGEHGSVQVDAPPRYVCWLAIRKNNNTSKIREPNSEPSLVNETNLTMGNHLAGIVQTCLCTIDCKPCALI